MNYHEQHQSTDNTLPVVSYFTVVKSEEDNVVYCQPTMEVYVHAVVYTYV